MAAASSYGRYGSVTLATDDDAFESLRGLLEQALSSARDYAPSSETHFLQALEGVSVYYDFLAPLPLLAYTRVTTSNLYATEKAGASYLLVYAEPVLTLALLLALPGPLGLGLDGVWLAVPAAQALNWAISLAVKHAVK